MYSFVYWPSEYAHVSLDEYGTNYLDNANFFLTGVMLDNKMLKVWRVSTSCE